ncbi:MAG: hypothetical protein IJW10_01245 [Clostridia bacterium]|nr:hypothetical protein [Clostridia bacterium]
MKKIISFILSLVIIGCFASCNSYGDSSSQSNSSSSTPVTSTDSSDKITSSSAPVASADSTDKIINIELKATSIFDEYYSVLDLGEYLGDDLPDDIGCFYREITSLDDLCVLVERYDMLNEAFFEESFVLVIKRISGGYFGDIGFKGYDPYSFEIELDSFPNVAGTDGLKTKIDYLILPKYKAQMEEDHPFTGKLNIKESAEAYYTICSKQEALNDDIEQAMWFEDVESANTFLTGKGYERVKNYHIDNSSILLLNLNASLDEYKSSCESSYLGFKEFNTNGTDIYITLHRNIVNKDYGEKATSKIYCIAIPNNLICNDIIDNPTFHILVQDNVVDFRNDSNASAQN